MIAALARTGRRKAGAVEVDGSVASDLDAFHDDGAGDDRRTLVCERASVGVLAVCGEARVVRKRDHVHLERLGSVGLGGRGADRALDAAAVTRLDLGHAALERLEL